MINVSILKQVLYERVSENLVIENLLENCKLGLENSCAPHKPLDLHTLGTPPAFILSQDQTLILIPHYYVRFAHTSGANPVGNERSEF